MFLSPLSSLSLLSSSIQSSSHHLVLLFHSLVLVLSLPSSFTFSILLLSLFPSFFGLLKYHDHVQIDEARRKISSCYPTYRNRVPSFSHSPLPLSLSLSFPSLSLSLLPTWFSLHLLTMFYGYDYIYYFKGKANNMEEKNGRKEERDKSW